MRYAHQSEEEANSVRIARTRTGISDDDSEQEGNQVHPHRPPADASHDTQRRRLAKEINEIIKASTTGTTGESTGLNRRSRWGAEKPAAGSTLPAGGVVTVTGNTANAQLAARKTAKDVSVPLLQQRFQLVNLIPYSQVEKKRAAAFKELKDADSLTSAKISPLNRINDGSFGFAVLDDQIILVHGVFYSSYLQFLLLFYVDISSYIVREGGWQGGKTFMDFGIFIYWCLVLHCSAVL